jgi:hypothetical protein
MISETTSVALRMRDVCLALGVASKYAQRLTRIQLQKYIYLLDVISPVYAMLSPKDGHLTYKHGPYDATIQNAVDALAFCGLVSIAEVKYFKDKSILSEYELSNAGISWLTKLITKETFETRWETTLEIGSHVNRLGWDRLVDLVYAEPTFLTLRKRGYGVQLRPFDGLENSAAFLLSLIEHSFDGSGKKLGRSMLVDSFFRYLDQFDMIKKSREQ